VELVVVFAILVGHLVVDSIVAKSVAGSFVKVIAAADPSVVTIEIQKEVVEIEIVAWEFLVG